MKIVIPISKRGTLTLPQPLREKYDVETPGQVEVVPEDEGVKIKPISSFMKKFGVVEHRGKPLDFDSLRRKFEKEISTKKDV